MQKQMSLKRGLLHHPARKCIELILQLPRPTRGMSCSQNLTVCRYNQCQRLTSLHPPELREFYRMDWSVNQHLCSLDAHSTPDRSLLICDPPLPPVYLITHLLFHTAGYSSRKTATLHCVSKLFQSWVKFLETQCRDASRATHQTLYSINRLYQYNL